MTSTHEPWADLEDGSGMNQILIGRWKEAIERNKGRLSAEDCHIIESLRTPEALLEDLQKRHNEAQSTWLRQINNQLKPFLSCLHSISTMFVVAMLPQSIETSLAWGVLSIILRLGLQTEERSRKMIDTLNSVRKALNKINRYAGSHIGNDDEVREVLMEIHIKLLEFWMRVVKELRKNPLAKSMDWKHIDSSLDNIVLEIQESYENIREMVDANALVTKELALHSVSARSVLQLPVFVLPIPENPDFFGREDTIQRIHEHLDPAKRQLGLACFTIYGMGGIGKTQVAASYAYRYCRNAEDKERSYDATLWVASETRAAMHQSFSAIALALKLPGINERSDPASVLAAVHLWLKQTENRWLLIFDNVEQWDDIMLEFWPQPGARGAVIVTSRNFHLAHRPASAGEQLQIFTADESSTFAKSILKDWDLDSGEEQKALGRLLSRLDGLPLAIHQISSLINAEGSCVAEFLEAYEEHVDEYHKERGADHKAFYPHTLETVWLFAIRKFSHDPDAQLLLGMICLLSPDSIPEKLFHVRKNLVLPGDDAQFCSHHMKLRKAFIDLRASGIISISKSNIRIHRLMQSAFTKTVEPDSQSHFFDVISVLLNDAFPKQLHGDPLYDHWPTCSKYILHAQALARNWRRALEGGHAFNASKDFLELLSNAAWYFRETGDFTSAMELVDIGLQAAGSDHKIIIAHLLNTSGVVKGLTYQYSSSRKVLEECLNIRLGALGSAHLETTGVKMNLASIVAAQGQYDVALKLYQQAEEESMEVSAQDRRLASCRYAANYGRCFTQLGELADARVHLQRSRDILNSGKDNPLYRRAIEYCFGNLNLAENKLEDARASYRSCLDDYAEDILEKNTHMTCGCHYKLSLTEMQLGDQERALGHLDDAMEVAQKANAQGYIGRILTLKLEFARKNKSHQPDSGDPEEIQLKIKAVQSNLEAQSSGLEMPCSPERFFEYFIPWQAR